MSVPNQSGSPRDETNGSDAPVLQPISNRLPGSVEVVWSSPVSTGAGLGDGLRRAGEAAADTDGDATADKPERFVYAFESDLLDNAFVHWGGENGGELTLEMIPGFKKDKAPEADIYPAESLASGLGDLIAESPHEFITRLDGPGADGGSSAGLSHFQPDTSAGARGPNLVRDDGVEDPLLGWRPTGMVFFETLATPPRGTVYSSSLLQAFMNGDVPIPGATVAAMAEPVSAQPGSDAAPFFDFPESVAPAPPDATDDFPMEVVVKGGRSRGSGGGGGIWVVKFMVRMFLVLLALVGLGALVLGGSYIYYVQQRLYNEKTENRFATVIIKPGDSFRAVIDSMHESGLLRSYMGLDDRYIMRYLAYAFENSSKVKPGVYKFDTGLNLQEIYDRIIAGSKDYKITIPEGKTAPEIGKLVGSQYTNFKQDRFLQLVNDPVFIRSLDIDAPSLEGYLYPSTYYFGPGMKEEELIKLMVGTFQNKVKAAADKITTDGLTFQEHVIMASLIEREARMDEDRPLIASVMFNRMKKGMPLQIDATVNFALNDWRRLTFADYKVESPYNTYLIKGLPPGPITSPRIESLLATYDPPKSDYLYYVHKGDGHHAFAETYAQHQANVGRYIREAASGMGNMPDGNAGVAGVTLQDEVATESKAPQMAGKEPAMAGKEPAMAGTITIEMPESDAVSIENDAQTAEESDEKKAAGEDASGDKKAEKPDEKTDGEKVSVKESVKPKSY